MYEGIVRIWQFTIEAEKIDKVCGMKMRQKSLE